VLRAYFDVLVTAHWILREVFGKERSDESVKSFELQITKLTMLLALKEVGVEYVAFAATQLPKVVRFDTSCYIGLRFGAHCLLTLLLVGAIVGIADVHLHLRTAESLLPGIEDSNLVN
jgi:hypothetical protein